MVAEYRGPDKSCAPRGRRFRYVWEQTYDDSLRDYTTTNGSRLPESERSHFGVGAESAPYASYHDQFFGKIALGRLSGFVTIKFQRFL